MDAIASVSASAPRSATKQSNSLTALGSDEFLQLLITQLRHQDPMEPMGNEQLLQQIASVREIELSTTLAESLRTLTGEQRFGSASALLGQYVMGLTDGNGYAQSGIVEGFRFSENGQPILQLSNGAELPLDQLAAVQPPVRAAESLVGKTVIGVDRRDPAKPTVAQGLVVGVGTASSGDVILELDTGQDLRLRDFVSVTANESA